MLFGSKPKTVTSFESVTLRESGMRISSEHEILMKDGKAEISFYWLRYSHEKGEEERELKLRAMRPEAEVLALLNDCGILKWDGFNGPNPPGLLDGTMFRFNAVVNGDQRIYASGSNNFPKHYRELTDWLNETLEPQKQA